MQNLRPVYFALIGTVGLVVAGMAQTSGAKTDAGETVSEKVITPAEDGILRNPCPSMSASYRLMKGIEAGQEYRRRLASLPPAHRPKVPDEGGMGWAVPDAEYWRQMPAGARSIPTDWSGLSAIRFTNTQIGGQREICLSVQGDYDLWLLRDPLHEVTACISIHRPTRRVWFLEISRTESGAWVPKRAKDPCYSCHPSGPRLVRPLAEPELDALHVTQFNRRMLSYGACDFGESVNQAARGPVIADGRCSGCHNGTDRGKLYGIHGRLIRFKTEQEATMPPEESHLD